MADPRWPTTISNFKFYCFLLLFLAVQVCILYAYLLYIISEIIAVCHAASSQGYPLKMGGA